MVKYLILALLVPSLAWAQAPPQAVQDLAAVQIATGHLSAAVQALVTENAQLRQKVQELEKKGDDKH